MYDEESGTQIFPVDGSTEYSYTSSYKELKTIGARAYNSVMARKGGNFNSTLQRQSNQALAQLEEIQSVARTAENAFLVKYGFSSGGDNWSELIKGINYLLSTQDAFERNINLLKQVANGDRKDYRDINRFLIDKLQEAVYEVLEQVSLNMSGDMIAEKVIQLALNKLSSITETRENGKIKTHNPSQEQEAIHAFVDLYSKIQVVRGNPFFKGMVDLFHLSDFIEQVRNQLQTQGTVAKKDRLKITPKGKNYHGTLQELIDAALGSIHTSGGNGGISWDLQGQQVGGAGYKPDVILANIEVNYTGASEEAQQALQGQRSVRAKGIETMSRLFQNMKDAKGDIVLISNKNYLINEMFKNGTDKRVGGFTAQGDTNLNNLDALFSKVGFPNVEGLIDYLANAGDNMIAGEVDDSILDSIAARIGDFLFDDMEITPPSGLNVVHIFNLSGIYIPLSFVLEGVKNGLRHIDDSNSLENYVEVVFKSAPTEAPDWNETAFESFRKDRQQQSTISVHFMRDFAQIISSVITI